MTTFNAGDPVESTCTWDVDGTPTDPSSITLRFSAGPGCPWYTWVYGGAGSIVRTDTGAYSALIPTAPSDEQLLGVWVGTGTAAKRVPFTQALVPDPSAGGYNAGGSIPPTAGATLGAVIVRGPFPFEWDSPDIATTGFVVYTPTPGDIFYDAWIEVSEAWDGNTPLGVFYITGGEFPVGPDPQRDMTAVDFTTAGLIQPAGKPSLLASANLPGVFVSDDPVTVQVTSVVSDAVAAGVDMGAAALPVTVVADVSDEFVYDGSPGGSAPSETFTVAAGVYATGADLAAAMGAAVGSVSGEAFSTIVLCSDDGSGGVNLEMVIAGADGNDNSINSGVDDFFAIYEGGEGPYNLPFGNGADANLPPTMGAGNVYLATATPVTG